MHGEAIICVKKAISSSDLSIARTNFDNCTTDFEGNKRTARSEATGCFKKTLTYMRSCNGKLNSNDDKIFS